MTDVAVWPLTQGFRFAQSRIGQHAIPCTQATTNLLSGPGHYFELATESDAIIATRIINDVQRLGARSGNQLLFEEIYWRFLAGAAALLAVGVVFRQ